MDDTQLTITVTLNEFKHMVADFISSLPDRRITVEGIQQGEKALALAYLGLKEVDASDYAIAEGYLNFALQKAATVTTQRLISAI